MVYSQLMAVVVVVAHLEKMTHFFLQLVVEGEGSHLRACLGLWVMAAGNLRALGVEGRKTGTPSVEEGLDVCQAGWGVEQKERNLTVDLQVEAVGRWESWESWVSWVSWESEMKAVGVRTSQEKVVQQMGAGVCLLLGCWVLGISPL